MSSTPRFPRAYASKLDSVHGRQTSTLLAVLLLMHCLLGEAKAQPSQLNTMPSQKQGAMEAAGGNLSTLAAKQKIDMLIESGVLESKDNGDPDLSDAMTRQQLATVLAKIITEEPRPNAKTFSDIPPSEWLPGSITAGIIEGRNDGTFGPDPQGVVDLAYMTGLFTRVLGAEFTSRGVPSIGPLQLKTRVAYLPEETMELARQLLLEKNFETAFLGDYPYFKAGAVTQVLPTSLNATYAGRISGALLDNTSVTGSISMNVDFSKFGANPRVPHIPGTIVFDNNKGSASFTLVDFNGYVGDAMNGIYNGEALDPNGSYIMNGKFYGPQANEVAGDWTIKTINTNGGGTFKAKR